jgi:hypothetical protein
MITASHALKDVLIKLRIQLRAADSARMVREARALHLSHGWQALSP